VYNTSSCHISCRIQSRSPIVPTACTYLMNTLVVLRPHQHHLILQEGGVNQVPQPRFTPFSPIPRSSPCSPIIYSRLPIAQPIHTYLNTMPSLQIHRDYQLIDSDPHFSRVVRYFRPSDYATWAIATAAGPTALYLFGMSLLSVRHAD
jgi:hypothetical protein